MISPLTPTTVQDSSAVTYAAPFSGDVALFGNEHLYTFSVNESGTVSCKAAYDGNIDDRPDPSPALPADTYFISLLSGDDSTNTDGVIAALVEPYRSHFVDNEGWEATKTYGTKSVVQVTSDENKLVVVIDDSNEVENVHQVIGGHAFELDAVSGKTYKLVADEEVSIGQTYNPSNNTIN